MTTRFFFRFAVSVTSFALVSSSVVAHSAKRVAEPPLASVERFVQVCATRLDLSAEQSSALRTYLAQEMNYMSSQAANHSPAEVAELVPAEREELQRVAGHLLSPGQLRQFQELEATPKMQEFLRRMALAN